MACCFSVTKGVLSFGCVAGVMAPGLGSSERARALIAAPYACL